MNDENSEKQWTVPPPGSLKINIDGAYFAISGKAVLGVIIRDHEGNPMLTAWRLLFNCRDAEEAETLTVLMASGYLTVDLTVPLCWNQIVQPW
jgi:hypothetical protein